MQMTAAAAASDDDDNDDDPHQMNKEVICNFKLYLTIIL